MPAFFFWSLMLLAVLGLVTVPLLYVASGLVELARSLADYRRALEAEREADDWWRGEGS